MNAVSFSCVPLAASILKRRNGFSKLLERMLLALAVGTLLGDAIIHIIPEHPNATGLLLGIYLFFVLERFLQHFHSGHGHSHDVVGK